MVKLIVLFSLIPFFVFSQATGDYRTAAAGPSDWSNLASWERFDGVSWVAAPSAPVTSDGIISIQTGHTIQILSGASITADQIVIDGTLQVLDNGNLTVSGVSVGSAITVNTGGILEKQGTNPGPGTISGTTSTNTVFNSGAVYIHNFTNLSGNPVAATWNLGSEMQVVGYTGAITISGANWGGNFATVRYNCPNQASSLVNFGGLLTSIQQDLIVEATTTAGTGRLMFNSTGSSTTTIGGNLDISGPSRVWLTTSGPAVTVNVGGDFTFNPTIASTSQLSGGTGTGNLIIEGSATFLANNFTMASAAGGVANLSVNNSNSLVLNGGALVVSSGTSTGTININGGDFLYGGGNLTYSTTGVGAVNINSGNFTMTSTGTMNFASGTTGAGTLTIAGGNFSATNGSISETSSGTGTISFTTTSAATIDAAPARFPTGTIALSINKPAGSLQIINNNLTIAGAFTLTDGSLDLNGRTLTLGGNIGPDNWTSSSLTTTSPSALIIQGAGTLPATNMAIQNGSSLTTFTLNRTSTTLNSSGDISVTTLNLTAGTLTHTGILTMNDLGIINVSAGIMTNGPAAAGVYDVSYSNAAALNSGNELPSAPSTVLRNLSKSAAGVLTLSKDIDINGNLAITAGTLTSFLNGTISLLGNFSGSGAFTNNGGTMIFAGTGTQTLSGVARTFNNVTVNSGSSISSALGQTINGTFNNNGTISFTAGTLTLGAASVTTLANPSATTVNALTLNGTAVNAFTANSALTINGVFTINAGASVTASATSTVTKGAGNFVGTGSYTSAATTIFTTGSTSMSGAGSKSFTNIIVNTGATFSPTVSYTVLGDITVNGTGILADPNNIHTVTFDGTTIIASDASSTIAFDGVTINSPRSVTANTNITIDNAFSGVGSFSSSSTVTLTSSAISGGGPKAFTNLTVGSGASTMADAFTITGNIVMTGSLVSAGIPTFSGATVISGVGALTFSSDVLVNSLSSLTLGSGTVGVNGNITNSGTINPGTGILQFAGTSVITNTGTMNLNSVTISNTFSMTAPSTTLGIAGNFTSTGTFNNGGGTIVFNGTGTQTLSATETYNNVTVNAGATISSGASQIINGTFNNNGNVNFTAGTLTLGASSIAALSSTSTTSLNILTLTASGAAVTADGALSTIGAVNVNANASIIANSTFSIGGVLTISLGGSITANASSSVTKGAGNFVGAGNYVSMGTTTFTGATTLSGGGTKTFNNLVVNGTVSMAAISYQVNGDITGAGTLNSGTGASTVTFGGAVQTVSVTGASFNNVLINNGSTFTAATTPINFTGNLTINGAFANGGGTVTFTTAGTKTISGNSTTFNDITVGDGVTSTTVTNALTPLNLSGRLNINGTVANTFNTGGAGNFILLSIADNANGGSIGPITGSAVLNGNMTVQRHMDSESRIWRYIASPVVGATVADLQNSFPVTGTFTDPSSCTGCVSTSPSLYFYDLPGQTYKAYPTTGFASAKPLDNGTGYSAYVRQDIIGGPATINFPGAHIATGAGISLPVAAVANGFSLVGNPYPSAIVWDPAGAGYTGTTNIVTTIKVPNNGTGGPAFVDVLPGGTIAAGQAFWVTTTAAGGGVLTINENAKTSIASTFYRTAADIADELVINLTKSSTNSIDITKVRIQEGASINFDNFDSPKWNNAIQGGANQFDLSSYTFDNVKSLSTNSVPGVSCNQQINLRVADLLFSPTGTAETTADYTFNFNPSGSMKSLKWTLHDNYLAVAKDISSDPTYSFTVTNSSTPSNGFLSSAPNRFYLTVTSDPIVNNLQVTAAANICESSSTAITINGSQLNMMYGVEVNGTYYPNVAQGTGGNLNIPMESEWLNATTNTIKVKANSGCDAQFLATTLQISKESLYNAASAPVQSCTHGSVTFTATGAALPTNYNWYESEHSSTPLATGNQFITPSLSDTTTYYVAAFNSLGCEGARTAVTAFVGDISSEVTITPSASIVCRNSTITFNAASSLAGTFNWYATPTSTEVLSTSPEFTTPALDKTKKYYVSFVNNGCEGNRIEALAQISNFSPVLAVDNGSACAQGTYTFKASGAPLNAVYGWFETMDSAEPILESSEFTTPPVSITRNYYVAAKNELGCYTDRKQVTVTIDTLDPSSAITSTSVHACLNSDATIKLNDGGVASAYNWYETATSPDKIGEGNERLVTNVVEDKTFFVAGVNTNGCEGSRVEMRILVSDFKPVLSDANANANVCVQGSYTFKGSGAPLNATYVWFDSMNDATPLREGPEYSITAVSESRSYYVAARNEFGCYSDRQELKVTIVDPSSNISVVAVPMKCKNENATFVVSGALDGFLYNWYDSQVGGSIIQNGSSASYTMESLSGTTSYFVAAVEGGCVGSRVEATVDVITFEDPKITKVSDFELESNYDTGNEWYLDGVPLANENKKKLKINQDGTYGLKVSVEGCPTTAPVFDLVTGFEDIIRTVELFPNPTSEVLTIRFVGNEDVNVHFIDEKGTILAPIQLRHEGNGNVKEGELDVHSYSKGMYFIRIFSGAKSITHKVIIN